MMNDGPTISLSFPEADVALLTLDMPDKGANILSRSVLDELAAHLDELDEREGLSGLVITSAKRGMFVAGADVREFVASLDQEPEVIIESSRRGQQLFARLSRASYVTVAAVEGVCLGGGAELALWCDRRILADSERTEIGQPEVKLGILPGWGGTARIPRIVGLGNAVEIVTGGESLDPASARQMQLVDEVTGADRLLEAAIAMVREEQRTGDYLQDRDRRRGPVTINETEFGFLGITASAWIRQQTKGHYPAPEVALNLMMETAFCDEETACEKEAEAVTGLFGSLENRALLNVFFLQDRVKKDPGVEGNSLSAETINSVAVIGAGIMGSGIAAANVRRGIPVTMTDTNADALAAGGREILSEVSYNKRTKEKDIQRALDFGPLVDLSEELSDCTSADLVIEAIVERADVKQPVLKQLDAGLPPSAILASNTSTIPISQLASDLEHPERFCGIHFFNPVRRMKLVEVIRGEKTSDQAVVTAVAHVKRLGKLPVVVNDGPGFLVNRLLLPYMHEAILLVQEGASIREVDKAARGFGLPMGPIALYDVVGIDTAVYAGKTMIDAFPDRAENSPLLEALVEAGRIGQKSGSGFYAYPGGKTRGVEDPDLAPILEAHRQGQRSFSSEEIVARLLVPMLVEATRALADGIVRNVRDVDMGMIFGIGFPPFRGGPLFWADSLGAEGLAAMVQPLTSRGARYEITPLLEDVIQGKRTFYEGHGA
jgi:3-hydroxyacyl-CoA dehydrogenase/enoyl-CoA hydratase/3-hydroxybutyryl-CoA epimerase/3-hydroxyacyl-CoA dehydrogenase/enoyl-CoA hydratase/3-hydroxybutyryl-CoA epimerase/enoyl-CoA isomerase